MAAHYQVRRATTADLSALTSFFVKAYGARTIFQDPAFLRWFLGAGVSAFRSTIAIAPTGDIVGHYGALESAVVLDGKPLTMLWGVNAFTLPECRGHGLGTKLFAPWIENSDVFGVIGFNSATADFYDRMGFQLFGRQRFLRYVRNLDACTLEVVSQIGGDVERARELLPVRGEVRTRSTTRTIREGNDAVRKVSFGEPSCALATLRTSPYLRWRYIDQTWLDYEVWAVVDRGATRAYVAARRTVLEPTAHAAVRIVDAFGEPEALGNLVARVTERAIERGDLWVDFMATGRPLAVLQQHGFATLDGDDVALLPQVTSPIQRRDNIEYLGLYSREHGKRLTELDFDDTYFTRMDSDRDRVARLASPPRREAG